MEEAVGRGRGRWRGGAAAMGEDDGGVVAAAMGEIDGGVGAAILDKHGGSGRGWGRNRGRGRRMRCGYGETERWPGER